MVLRWISTCSRVHRPDCINTWRIQARKPAWLIDTHQSCLVPGNNITRYICLSYRWGKTPSYQTQTEFLAELQQPGYLNQLNARQRRPLPRTVLDAMQLIRDLDERYLWTDTVCTVQDDDISKFTEVEKWVRYTGVRF